MPMSSNRTLSTALSIMFSDVVFQDEIGNKSVMRKASLGLSRRTCSAETATANVNVERNERQLKTLPQNRHTVNLLGRCGS